MRKLFIASVLISLCTVDFMAFGAARRTAASTTTSNTTAQAKTTAARAAARPRAATTTAAVPVKTTAVANTTTVAKPTAARAAKKTSVVGSGTAKPKTARAGTTQKVINMGTKVSTATENTTVSQECQDAYYGCMDAFCMLDNTSGGRCQCSDRNKDLNLVLEEIMKLDEQSLAMATEGVERIQMGESADEIMARVKAAAESAVKKEKSETENKKVRKLDLTSWKNNSLFAEDEDFFAEEVAPAVVDTFADKEGDALHSAAATLCVKQIPKECAASGSFLQLAYAQKIRSDCSAYENSLKQQRASSTEKLQTAQKALRDAALEAYQNENKYDFGQCVVQFKECMKTTGECGDDYSGCVADTAILDSLYNQKKNKKNGQEKRKAVATTVISTGVTTITISSATYDILNTKKVMCESVTKQCVNANKKGEVWQQVIKDLAPVVYTAEYNAASNNRMNCISTVANCVKTACGSKWDEESDNYDACLSDPNSIDNYCELEYKRCGDMDTEANVKNYVVAKLSALKVDKCTKDIKECLLSEDRCGANYAGCLGLDSDTIADLCPEDKLISCQSRSHFTNSEGNLLTVREYVAQVAQGLALNIDNKFATACQNAARAAFERVCGVSEDDSMNANICSALDTTFSSLDASKMTTAFFYEGDKEGDDPKLYDALDQFVRARGLSFEVPVGSEKHITNMFKLRALVRGQMDVSNIIFNGDTRLNNSEDVAKGFNDLKFQIRKNDKGEEAYRHSTPAEKTYDGYDGDINTLMAEMNRKYDSVIQQISSDETVYNCMHGRTVQAFSSTKGNDTVGRFGRTGDENARFPHLLDDIKIAISDQILNSVSDEYKKVYSGLGLKPADLYQQILDYYMSRVEAKDAELDAMNEKICNAKRDNAVFGQRAGHTETDSTTGDYDKATNYCSTLHHYFECKKCKPWSGWFSQNSCKCSYDGYDCGDKTVDAPGSWCHTGVTDNSFRMSYVNSDTGQICKSNGSSNATCPSE